DQGSSSSATTAVLGVLAYPPSLPFYLGRPIAVATATGIELTSNYIADYQDRYRDVPGSPLLPEGYWREALARCPVPTVFVATAAYRYARAALEAAPPHTALYLLRNPPQSGYPSRPPGDIEPIVPLYERLGPDGVGRLDGMFALAVWDDPQRRLLLARDRAGEKPLFWTQVEGEIRFASEI